MFHEINSSFMIGTSHQILFAWWNTEELDVLGISHVWGEERYVKDLVAKQEEKEKREDIDLVEQLYWKVI
jgi:hypothetical protein